ncbi:nitrite reductase [Azotosporobacter soli]|uniref:nitrite reductase n=1 Tax=Azotosporobacter soli TaxID=3055040 RepID=UPI0031FF09FD
MDISKIPFLNKRIKFPVAPHIPGGITTPEQLRQIAAIAASRSCRIKISGNTLTLLDLPAADGAAVLEELGCQGESFINSAVRGVNFCPGKGDCPRGMQNSSELGLELDRIFFAQETPGKVRIAVSGCPNCCAECFVRDIGLFGTASGYTLLVGGSSGRQARIATEVRRSIDGAAVPALIEAILAYYRQHGKAKERLGAMLDRTGWAAFQTYLDQASGNAEERRAQAAE